MVGYRLSRMGICSLTLALAFVSVPAQAAEVSKFLPSDSEAVWTLNVKQLLDSGLVKKYAMAEITKNLKGNADAQKAMAALGFDPLKDVSALIWAHANLD